MAAITLCVCLGSDSTWMGVQLKSRWQGSDSVGSGFSVFAADGGFKYSHTHPHLSSFIMAGAVAVAVVEMLYCICMCSALFLQSLFPSLAQVSANLSQSPFITEIG